MTRQFLFLRSSAMIPDEPPKCYVRDAFERTRVRATHPRVHSRTHDTHSHSRHKRTWGNYKTTRFNERTENFISQPSIQKLKLWICLFSNPKRTSFFIELHSSLGALKPAFPRWKRCGVTIFIIYYILYIILI